MFYHSLVSDWNHGNAHFLRGVVTELLARGHSVSVHEPRDGWSLKNLLSEHGQKPVRKFHAAYPGLSSTFYDPAAPDLDAALEGADVAIVHEWTDPGLAAAISRRRAGGGGFRLLFHDTHHRLVSAPESIAAYELEEYDGILAYGETLRILYAEGGRVQRAWTWHEAADVRIFRPMPDVPREGDLVWIGNWGDDERAAELEEFLMQPVKQLGLKARVFGVRYPEEARRALDQAGIEYCGWLPNFEAPRVMAHHRVTVHVPRRPYVKALPGIPTIRPFEALACGIPLVCSPWDDVEGLFRPGLDYLEARNGSEMTAHLKAVLNDPDLAASVSQHGLETIHQRHTCAHRVDELLGILRQLGLEDWNPARREPIHEIAP